MLRAAYSVLFLFGWLLLTHSAPASSWNYPIGEPAPQFTLEALDGTVYRLSDLQGKWIVVSFMATWCPYCNAAVPHFEELNREYSERGVKAFIVDVSEPPEIVSRWVSKRGLTCLVLLDRSGEVTTKYAPPPDIAPDLRREEVMLASFMIVDPAGTVRFMKLREGVGNFDARLTTLRTTLDALLTAQ